MRRLAGGEVERALSVVFYYLAVIFVEAADVPQCAEAESPSEPGLAETRYDAAVERRYVAEHSQHDLRRQSPGWPGAIGVAQGFLDIARCAYELVARRFGIAVRIDCPGVTWRAGDQLHHRLELLEALAGQV